MASPQKENGYTAISNELLEKIVATPLPDNEHRMLLFIIRKTYGFNKKEDKISLTQFEKALKRSRPVIMKALKNLILRNMVVRTPLLVISFQKDHERWVVAPPLLVKNKSKYSSPAPTNTSSPAPTHKRQKTTKDNIAAEAALPIKEDDDLNRVIDYYHELVKWRFKVEASWGRKNYGTLSALLEKRTTEEISNQLKWWFSQEQKELERMGFDFSTIFSVYSTNKYKLYVATK